MNATLSCEFHDKHILYRLISGDINLTVPDESQSKGMIIIIIIIVNRLLLIFL